MIDFEHLAIKAMAFYTINETCKILQCHRNSLRNWTETGRIKATYNKATCKKLYKGAEIEKFLRQVM